MKGSTRIKLVVFLTGVGVLVNGARSYFSTLEPDVSWREMSMVLFAVFIIVQLFSVIIAFLMIDSREEFILKKNWIAWFSLIAWIAFLAPYPYRLWLWVLDKGDVYLSD